MAQVKVKCTWSQIPNSWLKDKNLSLKAKGLITVMQSLPDNWDFSVQGLASILKECSNTINTVLQELEEVGYLTREQIRENGKIVDTLYTLHEFPHVKNADMVNSVQYNTNKENTKKREKADSPNGSSAPSPFSVDVSKQKSGFNEDSQSRKKEFAFCGELLVLMGLSDVKPGIKLRSAVRARLSEGYSELDLRAIARWASTQEEEFYKVPHSLFSEAGVAGATAKMKEKKKANTMRTIS
jgi:predicted transcriptional regulator